MTQELKKWQAHKHILNLRNDCILWIHQGIVLYSGGTFTISHMIQVYYSIHKCIIAFVRWSLKFARLLHDYFVSLSIVAKPIFGSFVSFQPTPSQPAIKASDFPPHGLGFWSSANSSIWPHCLQKWYNDSMGELHARDHGTLPIYHNRTQSFTTGD